MRVNHKLRLAAGVLAITAIPVEALAQGTTADLMGLSTSQLRDEIGRRYTDALALTQDPAVVAADNPRFLWASQAKAQCGIALGFLKSGHKDPVSVGKCDDAWRRMQALPPVVIAAPVPPPPLPPACGEAIAGIVFFEWDSDVPPESAGQTLDAVVQNAGACRWQHLVVTGHTDRSGSDSYNNGLSVRRANAVANLLGAKGIDRGILEVSGHGESEPRVPTVDGERNPQNRRVEITVK
jgi:outer membrane protein OmpA-like peptidoglycan-associated protein